LFHGQFRVTRRRRLFASLGGRMGPCSKEKFIVYSTLKIVFSTLL